MISYYELLGMIKDGNIPEKIRVSLTMTTDKIYVADYDGDEFSCYLLENRFEEDENYRHYLSESLLEMTMFDPCIEILDAKSELTYLDDDAITLGQVRDKVNEIIKFIKEND